MDTELLLLFLGIGIFSGAGGLIFLLVVRDTVRRSGNWGVNLKIPTCPECGAKMSSARKPTSFRQAVLGGWDCPFCSCEMDKWGKRILPATKYQIR